MAGNDYANLVIRVESLEAATAKKRVDGLAQSGGKAEKATDRLTSSFARLAGPLAGIVSISAGLNKLYDVTLEFQKLNVQLETATGSAQGAAEAMDFIRQFAEQTKQPINEVAQAFVKLKNLGLDPSEEALLSYGNTAAAMGKSLDQLIEAVADAATGEFERLKEFGIKSSVEGDKVKFTFQGVTTEVEKSAGAIEGYLQGLGNNQFAGALEKQANTLEGSINDLENAWNDLFLEVSESGSSDLMADAFDSATAALRTFTTMLKSGEIGAYIDIAGQKFEGFTQDVINGFTILEQLFREEFQLFQDTGVGAIDFVGEAFLNFPENVRAAIQIAAVELAHFVERVKIFGEEIAHDLNPQNWFTDDSDFEANIQRRIEAANAARSQSVNLIFAERDAKIEAANDEIEAAGMLTEKYLALQAAKRGDTGETGGNEEETEEGGENNLQAEDFELRLDNIRTQLELENLTYEDAYARRQEIMANALKAGQVNEDKFLKTSLKFTRSFLKAKSKDEKDSANQRLAIQQGFFQSGLTIAQAAFGKSKGVAKAISAINTIESMVSSYAKGSAIGGPPLGAAFAAAAYAAQSATSAKMDGISIGGGSVGGPGSSSVPSAPSLPPLDAPSGIDASNDSGDEEGEGRGNTYYNFTFTGPVNQAESMMDLIAEQINELDGTFIDPKSRQAQIIREGSV